MEYSISSSLFACTSAPIPFREFLSASFEEAYVIRGYKESDISQSLRWTDVKTCGHTKTRVPSSGDHEMNTILFLDRFQHRKHYSFLGRCGAVPCALPTVQLILKVVYRIPWALPLLALVARLRIHNLLLEVLPFRIRGGFLDNDLFVVVRQLVDDIFDRFAQFEVVEFGDAIGRDGDSVVKIMERFSDRAMGKGLGARDMGTEAYPDLL